MDTSRAFFSPPRSTGNPGEYPKQAIVKRHIIIDTLGHLLGVVVHGANRQDRAKGPRACSPVIDKHPSIQALSADQGYTSTTVDFVQNWLNRRVDISGKPTCGFQILPKQWIVERTFAWLGGYRQLAKDF